MATTRTALLSLKRLFTSVFTHYTTFNPSATKVPVQTGSTDPGWAYISQLQDKSPTADIASASTVDLTAATGNAGNITGTTTITAFTLAENSIFWATAAAALPVTYNSSNLKIRGNTSLLCQPGDILKIVGDSSNKGHIEDVIPKAAQWIPRVEEVVSEADTYADSDTTDEYHITALATDVVIHDIAGTPRNGQPFCFVLTADGTVRGVDCPDFSAIGAGPLTFNIPANGTLIIDCKYNTPNGVWFATPRQQGDLYALQSQIADLQGMTRPIVPVTDAESPYLVDAALHVPGTIFTNTGTAGDVIFVLDDGANCAAGKTRFTFRNRDTTTTYKIQIQVNGTDHLYFDILGSPLDITGGATIGDDRKPNTFMTVEYQGGGVWASDGNSQNWS